MKPFKILFALFLGLGLVVALLLVASYSPAQAQGDPGEFVVDLTYDAIWGDVSPGDVVTVSRGTAYGAAQADGVGFFWTPLWQPDGRPADITGTDTLAVYVNGGLSATITVSGVTGLVDVLNDRVVGTIGGVAVPIPVTVTLGTDPGAPSATTTTDASGRFTATFATVDLNPGRNAVVEYRSGPHTVRAFLAPSLVFVTHLGTNQITGYAQPGQVVTAAVYTGTSSLIKTVMTGQADKPQGLYGLTPSDNTVINFGDVVEVNLGSGVIISTTAVTITMNTDPVTDLVTGTAPAGARLRASLWRWTDDQNRYYQVTITVDANGVYTASLSGVIDMQVYDWIDVAVADSRGNETALSSGAPMINVNENSNSVWARVDGPNLAVTATLDTGSSIYSKTGTAGLNSYVSLGRFPGNPDIQPGQRVTVETVSWIGAMTVASLSASLDTTGNRLLGDAPPGRVEARISHPWSGNYPPSLGWVDRQVTVTSPFTLTYTNFDVRDGDTLSWIRYFDSNGFRTVRRMDSRYLQANLPYGVGTPQFSPSEVLTATLYQSNGITIKRQTSQDTDSKPTWYWMDMQGQIAVGDWVTVTDGAGWTAGLQVPTLTVRANDATDLIWGQGPKSLLLVQRNWNDQTARFVPCDDYKLDAAYFGLDLLPSDRIETTYLALNGNRVAREFQWPSITARFDMQGVSDIFGHNAIPGNTIYITVTHPVSGVIASGTTSVGTGWEEPNGYWLNVPNGSLAPGNTVTVDFGEYAGSAYVDSVEVVTLTGQADVANDWVTGAAPAEGWVHGWAQHRNGNQSNDFSVQVDASGVYTLEFGSQGWDIQYGDEFHVYYNAPHGHQVEYYFWLPAPEVGVWKWNPGGGYARPGGVAVYAIEYHNDGNGVATDTLIVDTLPFSTTWAGDTSGVTPEFGPGGVITWSLGNLPPGDYGAFIVTLNVSDTVLTGTGVITSNFATITTTAPGDYNADNNTSYAGAVDVWESNVGVNIDKWPYPTDPTPGQEFDYTIRPCSERGAAFGPVWLTDTLPVSTTLLSWRPQDWRAAFWTEVVTTSGQLVLYAPGLPGNWCQDIYLRLLLDPDAPLGTALQNTVVITTPGDVDPNNNARTVTYSFARQPRYDVAVDKNVNNGMLVPGGWINYHVSYWNQGNSAVHAWVTDTLPPGTSYQVGSAREQNGGPYFPPAAVTSNTVVWDLGVLEVNENFGFDFAVDVSDTVAAGTVLTNCASVGITLTDDLAWNNADCVTETINASGPNLSVTKWSWWNGDRQIGYHVQFYNVGNQTINNVWITDTLPVSTTWDGGRNLWDWGRLISESLGSNVLMWELSPLYPGDSGWIEFNANLVDPNARPFWYTNTIEIDVPTGDPTPADNTYTTVDVKREVEQVDLDIYRTHIWGSATQGPITITDALTQTVLPWSGWFDVEFGDGFDPGEVITVAAGNGLLPVVIPIPDPLTGYASSITDTVWGQIEGAGGQQVEINLWDHAVRNVLADGSGNYSFTFPDVPRSAQGDVNYYQTIDYAQVGFHRRFQSPDLILRVNYGHDWVENNYEAGHTVLITVTDSSGMVKATAVLTTGAVPGWGGRTGFSTNWQGWSPSQPDIVPGDWVYGVLDNVYTSTVHVGTITGNVNDASDIISGTITADFTQTLSARCEVWVTNGPPSIQMSVAPNGGSYECDFSTVGWDILPGQDVAVTYVEPGGDNDEVINVFYSPAPDMSVGKWREGNEAAPGGPIVFSIQYVNQGNAAGLAVLTDTLPLSTTYVTDSSGFPAFVSGNVITWNLGLVEPFTAPVRFQLVLAHTANVSDTLRNVVDIAADYDRNSGNNHAEAEIHVNTGSPDLYVNKNPEPGDPAPGQLFRYRINYGNNGPVASGPVWLTDTLPLSTTVVSWESQNDYSLWTEVITTGGQLVLVAPSVPGNWGDTIYLTLRVSDVVTYNTQLFNTVEITTTGDSNPDDNMQVNGDARVSPPRTNLYLDKSWGHGAPVPGSEINYWIYYNNNGNSPAHDVVLTDTLPAGTTFVMSVLDLGWGFEVPFSPTQIVSDRLVWDLGDLEVNEGQSFMMRLRVNTTTTVGTVFTNCATIAMSDFEDSPYENDKCVTETVRSSAGPDLDVTKYAYWQSSDRIQYQVRIRNVGGQAAYNVTVTETYPLSMTMNWWNVNCLGRSCSNSLFGSNPFTVTFEALYPGDTTWLNMELQVPAVPNGTFFTNTAEIITPPGDMNPDDNTSVLVVGTGPDLSIEKWLTGGTPKPGQLITYTLHFQNHSQAWGTAGNVWITDTLPAGLEFIASSQRQCGGGNYFCQRGPDVRDGQTLAWNYGQWGGGGGWNDLIITVQVTDTAQGGDVLTNTAIITSDNPSDVEPYYDDNTVTYPVTVLNPKFEIGKGYTGSLVVGMPLTYTVVVTNVGSETATGVVVTDALPANGSYVSGGVYAGGVVTLSVGTVLTSNPSSTSWVVSACQTSLVNRWYRVVTSTQGVTSTWGTVVTTTLNTPTLNAAFDYGPSTITVSSTVLFTSTSSTNGTPLRYDWDLGDGTAHVFTPNAAHTYTTDGPRTVRITITDTCGYTATHTTAITVNRPNLVANFDQSATSVVVSTTVYFTDTSTTNVPPIVAWEWDFGDGSAHVRTQNAGHTYLALGTHTVRLTVTDTLGYSNAHTATVTVSQPSLVANFDQSAMSVVVSTTVYFTDTSTTNGPSIVAWKWDWGDGSTLALTQNASHTYTTVGVYTVTLVVTDALGYSDSESKANIVTVTVGCIELTGVTFTFVPLHPVIHSAVTFTATYTPSDATQPITYTWDFGDGVIYTSTAATMQHTYTVSGTKAVHVTAYNPCTPAGVSSATRDVDVIAMRVFLPLVLR